MSFVFLPLRWCRRFLWRSPEVTPAHTIIELPEEFYILPAFYRKERARVEGTPWPLPEKDMSTTNAAQEEP